MKSPIKTTSNPPNPIRNRQNPPRKAPKSQPFRHFTPHFHRIRKPQTPHSQMNSCEQNIKHKENQPRNRRIANL